jgi:hypothetical protein
VPPTLHRVSLASGEERAVRLDAQGYFLGAVPFALGKDGLYWLRPGSQTRTMVLREKDQMAYELLPPQDDLMASPLDGGPARSIASGVLLQWLDVRGDGIYGSRPYPYPKSDAYGDLFRFPRAGGAPPTRLAFGIRVRGVAGALSASGGVESEGRYYWLDRDPEGREGVGRDTIPASDTPPGLRQTARRQASAGPIQLMSCRVDGSDVRPVCALVDTRGEGLYPDSLFTCQDRPYVIGSQIVLPGHGGGGQGDALPQVMHYIARVHPEAQVPLGEMRRLGMGRGNYTFSGLTDDDYYYFTLNDVDKSPLDFLSLNSTEHPASSFWRVRLPE